MLSIKYKECIEMKSNGDEECVMKIWEAGKGFTGFAHMMTHHLNTRRWLADIFV